MNIQELEKLVSSQKVHQIRAGKTHRFIDITIVSTEGRFFVRQYKFGKKSWYDVFMVNPLGQIRIGQTLVDIEEVPSDIDDMNPKVNKAYRKLLGLIYPIMRLSFNVKKHEASTLELIPKLKIVY